MRDRPNSSSLQVCDQDSIMEFGFELVCDQVRAISTCRDSSSLLEPGRRPVHSWSKPNSIMLSWLQTGPRLVADLLAHAEMIGQIPARCRSATSFGLVYDQNSVMEFGLYQLQRKSTHSFMFCILWTRNQCHRTLTVPVIPSSTIIPSSSPKKPLA